MSLLTEAMRGMISNDPTGQSEVIGYYAKKLGRTEQHWTTIEKEFFAIVSLFRAYEYMLDGYSVKVHTDNKSLVYLQNMPKPPPKLQRWRIFLNKFSFTLEHIKGKDNVLADYLSRCYDNAIDETNFANILVFVIGSSDSHELHASQDSHKSQDSSESRDSVVSRFEKRMI